MTQNNSNSNLEIASDNVSDRKEQTMKDEIGLSHIQEIGLEVSTLIQMWWVYKKFSERITTEDAPGIKGLENILLLKSLHDCIVLSLCRIGDQTRGTCGFPQVAKYAKKTKHGRSLPADIDSKIAL